MEDLGCRVRDLGSRVENSGLWVGIQYSGFKVGTYGLGYIPKEFFWNPPKP